MQKAMSNQQQPCQQGASIGRMVRHGLNKRARNIIPKGLITWAELSRFAELSRLSELTFELRLHAPR
jgi:hypothetical protein